MSHPSREDLTAYALGAVEEAESKAVADHVTHCERCSAELRYLAPAVGVLAESVDQQVPPPELRERVMSIVRSEASESAATVTAAPSETARRWFGGLSLRGLLMRPATGMAAVAVCAAALGGYLIAGGDSSEPATTVGVESPLPQAGGSLVLEEDGATLQVRGMPQLAKGAVYQVWVTNGGAVRRSAAFVPREDGSAVAAVPEARTDADQVLVTREPRAGVRTPTFPPVLTAKLN